MQELEATISGAMDISLGWPMFEGRMMVVNSVTVVN
jgi:hypothetical protein